MFIDIYLWRVFYFDPFILWFLTILTSLLSGRFILTCSLCLLLDILKHRTPIILVHPTHALTVFKTSSPVFNVFSVKEIYIFFNLYGFYYACLPRHQHKLFLCFLFDLSLNALFNIQPLYFSGRTGDGGSAVSRCELMCGKPFFNIYWSQIREIKVYS